MAKKQKRKPVPDEALVALRDTARTRKPLDGLGDNDIHAGVAVMYLDARLVDRLVSELIRRRKQD